MKTNKRGTSSGFTLIEVMVAMAIAAIALAGEALSWMLADDTEFELFLEDKRVLLELDAVETEQSDDDDNGNLTDDYQPHVLVLSSGDITPFVLEIFRRTDRTSIQLSASPAGELKVGTDEDL